MFLNMENSALETLVLDFLLAIEMLGIEGRGLPESQVRHTLSMCSPLGTPSDRIDRLAEVIIVALLTTGLVYQDNGVLMYMVQGGVPVAAYNPDDVTVN